MDDGAAGTDTSAALEGAQRALAGRDWSRAYELFAAADQEGRLSGGDLESFALAAFFTARADEVTEIKERSFKAHQGSGDVVRAAYLALDIAHDYALRGRTSIASAWTRRAERLLDGQPESYAHGYVALLRSDVAKSDGRIDDAIAAAEEAGAIARRTNDADLNGWALMALGTLRIATGRETDGIALLEEASVAAVNGELSPFATGIICCATIAACRDLTDYQRANEWIEATDRYCERQSVAGFPGVCRIHRAEIVALGGAWDRAEQELRQATSELAGFKANPPMADGFYALGEIRRLQGDLEGAEEALRQAHALGRTPQPGLALIRLAQGRVKAAAAGVSSALAEETWDRWARARLLPAQVEIAIAAGDVATARSAVEELEQIIGGYSSPAVEGGTQLARARVLLAEGDPEGAASALRDAIRLWLEVANPYEVARSRALLSRALLALGNEDDAELELRTARDEFARLGAVPDATAADRELRAIAERRAAPEQVRRTFLFTDVVGSTKLAELLGDEAWERLLGWHDRTIRRLVERHRGELVNSTGDGFFVAFADAGSALACAIDIQRELDGHRRETGFALSVRIGVHTAEANRRGDDYSGMGVHLAARVAGAATGGEILATTTALAEADRPAVGDHRTVELKGVSAPTDVASVSWS